MSYRYDADGSKIAMTGATRSSSYVYDPDGEQLLATQGSTTIASLGHVRVTPPDSTAGSDATKAPDQGEQLERATGIEPA
ncbi:MAG: hypothetical protein ACLPUG_00160 [Acidimicrobiales bacterium]